MQLKPVQQKHRSGNATQKIVVIFQFYFKIFGGISLTNETQYLNFKTNYKFMYFIYIASWYKTYPTFFFRNQICTDFTYVHQLYRTIYGLIIILFQCPFRL